MNSRKLLYVAQQPMQAELIATYLESHNVKVELEHQILASILPLGGSLGIKLWVHPAQFERAANLLGDYLNE